MTTEQTKIIMSKEEYIKTQTALFQIGQMVSKLDLINFINQISSAEKIAPMLHPDIYRKARENMDAIKNLALAFFQVQNAFGASFNTLITNIPEKITESPPTIVS